VPNAVHCSGCCDKRNCLRPLRPQPYILPLDHCNRQRQLGVNILHNVVPPQCGGWESNHQVASPIFQLLHYRATLKENQNCKLIAILPIHRVSKNVPPVACYNIDTHEQILIFFGRNVTTCGSALPGKTGKHEIHIFHSNAVLVANAAAVKLCCMHSAPVRSLSERKIVICAVFDGIYIC